jgi:hypothetical protein
MSDCCLTLLCPPMLEEKLLDLLLMAPDAIIFTSARTAAHGVEFGRLSATEQVLGRALATQVQVLLSAEHKDAILSTIRREFAGVGLRYWVSPITEKGELV